MSRTGDWQYPSTSGAAATGHDVQQQPLDGLDALSSAVPEGYEVLRTAGVGRLGVALVCRESGSGREVVLKVLDARPPDAWVALALQTELLAAGVAAQHPCAVPVDDAGRPCLLMEACPGGSAKARLEASGRLPVDEVVMLGIRVGLALRESHRRGVLHLDVRPANVLADAAGDWRLADSGVARAVSRAAPEGGAIFDPSYAPRELFGWEEPGPACDVYGLGGTLYALLAGAPAFADAARGGPAAMYTAVLTAEPAAGADVPAPLFALIRRMMAANPEGRPPLTEVDRILRTLLPPALADRVPAPEPEPAPAAPALPPVRTAAAESGGDTGKARPGTTSGVGPRNPRRRLVLATAAVGVLLGAVTTGVVLAGNGGDSPAPGGTQGPATPTATSSPGTAAPVPARLRGPYLARSVQVTPQGRNILVSWKAPRTVENVSGYVVVAQTPAGDLQGQQYAMSGQINAVFTVPPADAGSCFVVTTLVAADTGVQFARGEPVCQQPAAP
jgi:hypothetical protein